MKVYKRAPRSGRTDRKNGYSSKPRRRKAWNKGLSKQPKISVTAADKLQNRQYPETNFSGYRIFNLQTLTQIFDKFAKCELCHSSLTFKEISTVGLGSEFILSCCTCDFQQTFHNSEKIGQRNNSYEINQRALLSMRMIGIGFSGLELFCGFMDLPSPILPKSYRKMQKNILNVVEVVAEDSMNKAAVEEIKRTSDLDQVLNSIETLDIQRVNENGPANYQINSVKNIKVKGDGTWQRVGHQSLNGVTSVIGEETHRVLDIEALVSYRKPCFQWQKENGLPMGPEWDEWYSSHKASCNKNYTGSSGGMESAGMVRIFKRSVEKYNARYTHYIGDGDSATYLHIKNSLPYGPDVNIQKLECIGHVGKRIVYRLKKLRTTMRGKKLADGKSLFGRGRLTDAWILKIQIYYKGAIRNNPSSVCGMMRDIWAIWYHIGSSDENHRHHLCPSDKKSWCKYKRAKASGSLDSFKHTKSLPPAVMEAIKPVFIDMSDRKLLKRCLGGHTQNQNESFNNVLWRICPKNVFVGFETLMLCTYLAVIQYNNGVNGILKIMEKLGIRIGENLVTAAEKRDSRRLYAAQKQAAIYNKESRLAYRQLRQEQHEQAVADDGDLYGAGAY